MTFHYQDLASVSDWLKYISQVTRPVISTSQIWVAIHHQYAISELVAFHFAWKPVVASRDVG